ncbi:hypothetical protein C8Q77DRAFT_599566 [Trametes polyzona]|nr:hypothetical protein C8Q77DRAFT_599566 [Trametes polyzona]
MMTSPKTATAVKQAARPRILLRELRKRRHPRRSDSLPCLKLAPENRPYFVCQTCQFPNVLCELCPWCLCRCEVAEVAALVAVVRRRLSSPTLLSDAQKAQLARIESKARGGRVLVPLSRGGVRTVQGATSSHAGRATRANSRCEWEGECEGGARGDLAGGACAAHDAPEADRSETESAVDRVRREHRNAVLYSAADVVATATVDSTLQPFLDEIAATHLENQNLERRSVSVARKRKTNPSVRIARTRTTNTRMSTGDDVDQAEQSELDNALPAVSATPLPQPPSLRRKRRMSVLRQRSSCSLRRRATTTGSPMSHRRTETAPSTPASSRPKAASVRFSSPPPCPSPSPEAFPLGHPQRPLYTAIRKNMLRPSSPAPSMGSGSGCASIVDFDAAVLERGTRSLDIPRFNSLGRSYLSVAAYARPVLFPPSASGFSVSGETELRMDLARSRSMDGVPSDFAFREVKPDASTVKAKVKSFGKTLKSLLRGKI